MFFKRGSVIGDLLPNLEGHEMDIFIALKDVQQIKKTLARILPEVKSSHRVEAVARGFGWKSNAALRACLMCAPTRCRVR